MQHLWSSINSWDNDVLPVEGDIVVINQTQWVILDQDTPVLNTLLIDGGAVYFEPTKNVELKARYILIQNNGTLQVSR